jgi:hypothetical protein
VLFSILLVTAFFLSLTSANAKSPTSSVVNKVPDFYAEGKSGSYSIKISPKGGYLASSGPTLTLMPWGYVTAQWSLGTVYIIFLANVTASDFHIAFLYLTNSSTPFILRTFNYQGADLNSLTFDGIQYVFTRFVTTSSTPIPDIQLQAKAQSSNDLSAIGPELYINGNTGRMVNGSTQLTVFPLRDQFFSGSNDYNELWSLLTDDVGNYYFGIFYMQNSDPSHIIIEHQVRLNDYQIVGGKTFDANWVTGPFTSRLTIRLPFPNSIVKVDGFPFQTDNKGVLSVWVPRGSAIVEVLNDLASSAEAKSHFSSWKNHGTSNPLNIQINSALDLTANYRTQYLLALETAYGAADGAGWYDQGANATFSVPEMISSDNGTRRVFQSWEGDYSSDANSGWLVVNSPKHVAASWKTQFEVKLQLAGVPANATATVVMDGQPQLINGSKAGEFWVDSNARLSLQVENTMIQGTTTNYNFTGLQVDSQPSDTSITVTKPIVVAIVYSPLQKAQSAVALRVDPNTVGLGYPLTLSGSVPVAGSSTVNLYYGSDNVNWQLLENVTTQGDGTFTYTWKPNGTGTYFVKAYWAGDAQHVPASQEVTVHVQEASLPNFGDTNDLSKLVRSFLDKAWGVPFASVILKLVESLLVLGAVIALLLVPGGSPVLGYFIGSFLVGFVFIFPISALVLSLKAARSHRRPSVMWLTPLATIWIVALTMLTTNGALFGTSPLLVEASAILLMSSNALLMPLSFSLLLAKVAAS